MSDIERILESALARAKRFDPNELWWRKIKVRKGPKKHSVNRERSQLEQKKYADSKRLREQKSKTFYDYKGLVMKYWRGEIENFPPNPLKGEK